MLNRHRRPALRSLVCRVSPCRLPSIACVTLAETKHGAYASAGWRIEQHCGPAEMWFQTGQSSIRPSVDSSAGGFAA
jgi:hypothetical protein